jgi:hypothetical protein
MALHFVSVSGHRAVCDHGRTALAEVALVHVQCERARGHIGGNARVPIRTDKERLGDAYIEQNDGTLDVIRAGAERPYSYAPGM